MIRELRTLVAVAREGSFAAAGNKVGLTQAAVSAQMQRLEGELGYALFDREGRSARLNRRGQQTLLRAQELIWLYANLGHSADAPAAAAPIAIGAIASAQRTLLPDALAAFYREHPQHWSASSRASQCIWSIWLMLARSTWPSSSGRRFRCRATCAGPRSRVSPIA